MRRKLFVLAVLGLALSAQVPANDRLINVEGPGVAPSGSWRLGLGATLHRSHEDRTYVSFDGRFGLESGWEMGLRGTVARVGRANTFASLRSGGTDLELFFRHALQQFDGLTVQGGVAFPNTPAQDSPFITAGVAYRLPMPESQFKVIVGTRGIMKSGSTAVGISGGVVAPIGQGLEFMGDVTAIVRGVNTRDSRTGNTLRRMVYGVGLRYSPTLPTDGQLDWSVYIGLSNALGFTTATSLSSALGNQPALTLGVVLRGKS